MTTTGSAFTFSNPVRTPRVFMDPGPTVERMNDIARDGRFLGVVPVGRGAADAPGEPEFGTAALQVVLNWFTELTERVPTR